MKCNPAIYPQFALIYLCASSLLTHNLWTPYYRLHCLLQLVGKRGKLAIIPTSRVLLFIFSRLHTLKQLFRIILDVINPSFVVEDRQWQPSAVIIFYSYFTALWQDPQVSGLLDYFIQSLMLFCRKKSRLPWIPGPKHCFLLISKP